MHLLRNCQIVTRWRATRGCDGHLDGHFRGAVRRKCSVFGSNLGALGKLGVGGRTVQNARRLHSRFLRFGTQLLRRLTRAPGGGRRAGGRFAIRSANG